MVQLTASGRTIEDVAQKLSRTPEAIRRRTARLGITPPARAKARRQLRACRLARLTSSAPRRVVDRVRILAFRSGRHGVRLLGDPRPTAARSAEC